jgi:NADH-quinone oxidoreductase subunit E
MDIDKILKNYQPTADNLLAILHDLQNADARHFLSPDSMKQAADYLKLPYSYVYGVASFYTMYSFSPRGKYIVRICQSPPCHLMDSTTIVRELMKTLEVRMGETTTDGLFTLEMSSCLGVCGVAPAMTINDEVYGNLTPERIREIIAEKRREQ